MFHLFTTQLALFVLLASTDVPEMEPFDRDEFEDAFDRLQGQPADRNARKRSLFKPALGGSLVDFLRGRSHTRRSNEQEADDQQ
jgi:hypothetical protein